MLCVLGQICVETSSCHLCLTYALEAWEILSQDYEIITRAFVAAIIVSGSLNMTNSGLVNLAITWLHNDWVLSRLDNAASSWLVTSTNTWVSNIFKGLAALTIHRLDTLTNTWLSNICKYQAGHFGQERIGWSSWPIGGSTLWPTVGTAAQLSGGAQ